jgi:AraC-like DNA-binding protein
MAEKRTFIKVRIELRSTNVLATLAFFMLTQLLMGQQPDENSLRAAGFDSLITLFDRNSKDSMYARSIARVYIDKARLAGDSTKMARGYQRIAFVSPLDQAVKYLDTTIVLSARSDHPNFPASGYLFKAHYLYEQELYEESLQSALLGYRYAKEKENVQQQLTALYLINGVNELWGDYRTALQTGFLTYDLLFENQELPDFTRYYLSSLESIGKCYVRLNRPDSALIYFKRGIDATLKQQDSISYYAFVSQSGTAYYTRGNYQRALDSLFKADVIRDQYNNSYLPSFYYYVGSSYFDLGEQETAMGYFHRIDSIYQHRKLLFPELPKVYDRMVQFYGEEGSPEKQLEYLRKQVETLRLIDDKRIFIKRKTNQDYVIPSLVAEKEAQIALLESKNRKSNKVLWISLGLLLLSAGFLVYYFRRQRRFQRRFEELMADSYNRPETAVEEEPLDEMDISDEIIQHTLRRMEKFEEQAGFRDPSITLNKLAKQFDTNSTYLSKIINVKKGKNFSRYLNDLRVDFALRELKEKPTFRKYTIKAIAQECGFKSAESFSKSFYRKHRIYPSYYIKQLEGA